MTDSQINKIRQLMIIPGVHVGYSNTFADDLLYLFLSNDKLYDFRELKLVIELISHGNKLPKRYHQHRLRHQPDHIMDIHVEHDWILLYKIFSKRPYPIILYRTGTHKQLFKR